MYTALIVLQNSMIDEFGILQNFMKFDPQKRKCRYNCKQQSVVELRARETYGFEIIEMYDIYTRSGEVIMIDGINYVI